MIKFIDSLLAKSGRSSGPRKPGATVQLITSHTRDVFSLAIAALSSEEFAEGMTQQVMISGLSAAVVKSLAAGGVCEPMIIIKRQPDLNPAVHAKLEGVSRLNDRSDGVIIEAVDSGYLHLRKVVAQNTPLGQWTDVFFVIVVDGVNYDRSGRVRGILDHERAGVELLPDGRMSLADNRKPAGVSAKDFGKRDPLDGGALRDVQTSLARDRR